MAKTIGSHTSPGGASARTHLLPILRWLPDYDRKVLRFDVIAAVTVAAFSVPESMAYVGLAGVPPQAGLYAGMAVPIAYALFGTSRQLGVGATSALSILVASSIGGLAAGDAHRFAALACRTGAVTSAPGVVMFMQRRAMSRGDEPRSRKPIGDIETCPYLRPELSRAARRRGP